MLLRNAHPGSGAKERSLRVAHGSHPWMYVAKKMVLVQAVVPVVHGGLCLGDGGKEGGAYFPLIIAANRCVDCQVERSLVVVVSLGRVAVLCQVGHCI